MDLGDFIYVLCFSVFVAFLVGWVFGERAALRRERQRDHNIKAQANKDWPQ